MTIEERSAGESRRSTGPATKERRYCTFFIDGLLFGVGVEEVQEVIRYQEMTPVPLAPPSIRGLINLRGQIVTAIDVRRRLGLPDREDGSDPMNVVIHGDDGAVSLLVDEIGDVVDVTGLDFEEAPETLRGIARLIIAGVYKLDGQLLRVLDSTTTIAAEDY